MSDEQTATRWPPTLPHDKGDERQQEPPSLLLLEGVERIRRVLHEGQEYWSVVDVIAFLTDSANPSKYWYVVQKRMQSEGARETLSQIIQLPMSSADGAAEPAHLWSQHSAAQGH